MRGRFSYEKEVLLRKGRFVRNKNIFVQKSIIVPKGSSKMRREFDYGKGTSHVSLRKGSSMMKGKIS